MLIDTLRSSESLPTGQIALEFPSILWLIPECDHLTTTARDLYKPSFRTRFRIVGHGFNACDVCPDKAQVLWVASWTGRDTG